MRHKLWLIETPSPHRRETAVNRAGHGVFVAAVNRVGVEDDIRFWGQSFVVDPFGKVIAKASPGNEESLMVECDLALIEKTRREWPFLRDRRIDAYDDLNKRMRDK